MSEARSRVDVRLRPAREDDARAVHAWRNAAETRRHFFDPAPVSWTDHAGWFARTLAAADRHLLIAEDADGTPLGVLRFDETADGAEAEASIYLVPGVSGRGLGRAVMAVGMDWLRAETAVRRVTARVKEGNGASIRMFEAAGFATDWRAMSADLDRKGP